MRPRLQSGASVRPLNFTVRPPMKRLTLAIALVTTVLVAAAGSYIAGFRQAWRLSVLNERPIRGALSLGLIHALDKGKVDDVRTLFESDIDNGLLWWSDVERFPLYGVLNALSGDPYASSSVDYVRRIARYRSQHESPLNRPEVVNGMLDSVRKTDPAMADQLAAGGGEIDARMAEVLRKYGQ